MAVTLFDSSSQATKPQPRKRVGGVRRRNETRDQFRGRMDGTTQSNNNSDIDAIFRGIQQTRTKVHKGLSGMPLNPDGTDPGNSFDRFMRQNPHLGGAAQRQTQYDQQARGNMASAVAERKALQEIQSNTPSSKSVVGADGYRSIFDSSGNAVGTTAPVGSGQKRVFDDASGQMVPMDQWFSDRQKVQASKGMTPTPMRQAAQRSVASKPSGMDQIFGGGTKQPSPSGVAGGGVVEPPQPKGAPGGELFGQMPEFKSSGMAAPQYVSPDDTPGAASVAARAKAFPRERMQAYVPPYSSPEQLQALSVLKQLFGEQSPASAGLEASWTNMFKGQDDWAYLNQLFPDLVQPGVGSSIAMRNLQKLYRDPVYQSRF